MEEKNQEKLYTIFDYLIWRGDIPLEISPFNMVDNLVLSQASYLDFSGVVPGLSEDKWVFWSEVCERIKEREARGAAPELVLWFVEIPKFVEKAGATRRFGGLKMAFYQNIVDKKAEEQFAAVTFDLGSAGYYIAFAGTDDSLVGWKEDFNLCFLSAIPAQLDAVEYVNQVAAKTEGPLYLGGHSKGGNLAGYAAAYCKDSVKKRIATVFSNDGPGYTDEMINGEDYKQMRSKMRLIVPEHSFIGRLLDYNEEYLVVKSSGKGLLQHDATTWAVLPEDFDYAEKLAEDGIALSNGFKNFLQKMDNDARKNFTNALFSLLDEMKIETLDELLTMKPAKIFSLMSKLIKEKPEKRAILNDSFFQLVKELIASMQEQKQNKKAAANSLKKSV